MRLTVKNIHTYLLDKGFIDIKSLVDGDYTVAQAQTRNIVFKVIRKKAKSLFVKQLNSFDQQNAYVLQKDATCLWLIKNYPAFQNLSAYVPDYFGYDPEKQVLVTEYLPDTLNLEEYIRLYGSLPYKMIEALAKALTDYHLVIGNELQSSRSVQFFPRQLPWVLQTAGTDAVVLQQPFAAASNPDPVLQAVNQHTGFSTVLSGIQEKWVFTSLIHGDLKWLNLLTYRHGQQEQIKIVDWEIADIGDPSWDVAGIFHGFIATAVAAVYSLVGLPQASPNPEINLGSLEAAMPPMRHFWKNYFSKKDGCADPEKDILEKCIQYTGVRLIQTAIEQNGGMPTVQPFANKLLEASYTVLSCVPEILSQLLSKKIQQHEGSRPCY